MNPYVVNPMHFDVLRNCFLVRRWLESSPHCHHLAQHTACITTRRLQSGRRALCDICRLCDQPGCGNHGQAINETQIKHKRLCVSKQEITTLTHRRDLFKQLFELLSHARNTIQSAARTTHHNPQQVSDKYI